MEIAMRKHHAIAVVAVLLIGVGVKQFFFPPKAADADINAIPGSTMNVLQMHIDHPNPPVQKTHDMTFVFDSD
jgi:hypothetical protein